MQCMMLKAKLHRVTVTHAHLHYEGSCAIDGRLLDAAGIHEYEQIHVYNIDNGERFITYAIRAEDDSGIISLNGAAAHKANPGHLVIICAYALVTEQELRQFKPSLVYVDNANRIRQIRNAITSQVDQLI
ncbi:aspartate 1-decarboxylase proenzyme [Gammaproteobacteria bacterium]